MSLFKPTALNRKMSSGPKFKLGMDGKKYFYASRNYDFGRIVVMNNSILLCL